MKWVYILGAILAASILLGLSGLLKAGDRTSARCIDCSLRRTTQTKLGMVSHHDEPDGRTAWVVRRIRSPHDHHWARSSSSESINPWGTAIAWRVGELFIPVAGPRLVPVLERLEPLGLDLLYNDELTHPNPDRRGLAISAAGSFDPNLSDPELRTWWRTTRESLDALQPK